MNFTLFSAASPAGAAGGGLGDWSMYIMLAIMAVGIYFLMWRPQKKKEKQATELRNSIEVGDEVTTIGGIVGRVVSIKEDTFVIETAGDRSRMRFKRWAIQEVGKLNIEPTEPDAAINAEKNRAGKDKK